MAIITTITLSILALVITNPSTSVPKPISLELGLVHVVLFRQGEQVG
jgi:hypothetical protein